MDDIPALETTHNMHQGIHLANLTKKLIAQSFAGAGPLHQARNVTHLQCAGRFLLGFEDLDEAINPWVRYLCNSDIRLNGREGIISDNCPGTNERIEDRRLPNVR
jgi:hypothetical protein